MSRIAWTGRLNDQAVRVVVTDDSVIAERLLGHDAMGGERWEQLRSKKAIDELRVVLPAGLELPTQTKPPSRLPYGLVVLPKGLTFRDLTRVADDGTQALLLTFPIGFDQDGASLAAVEGALNGSRGKLVLNGHYERGAFVVQSAAHCPIDEEPVLEEHGCKLVTEALKKHLRYGGDPEERFALSSTKTVTAARLATLLEEKNPQALRFVQDIHNAALQSVRRRQRKPSLKPSW